MSVRTLVEINHDKVSEIGKNPERFVHALMHAIKAGGKTADQIEGDGYGGDSHFRLKAMGAEIKHIRHHSDPCPTDSSDRPYVDLGAEE